MTQADPEKAVYDVLDNLGISYSRHEHPPVFTVEEARSHWKRILGRHCKNIFLRNKKGDRHYLVIAEHSKNIDLKELTRRLGEDRLSFASAERLMKHLGVGAGAVSPFGLINDGSRAVQVIIDEDLKKAERVNFHPLINTATVGLSRVDFERFLAWCGNRILLVAFSRSSGS